MCAIFAAFIGIAIPILAQKWWLSAQPNITIVKDIQVRPADGIKDHYWIDVVIWAPPAHGCIRHSQHLIYNDRHGVREFIPLGNALNGMNFSSPVTDLRVLLDIPPGVSGDWWYVDRSVYSCVIWPGFVQINQYETPKINVNIPLNR